MFTINYRDYLQIFTQYDLVEKFEKKKKRVGQFSSSNHSSWETSDISPL